MPEGTAAVRLPTGEVIRIDGEKSSFDVLVSRENVDETGRVVLTALNDEHIPLGRFSVDLSGENGALSGKTGFGKTLVWIAAGLLVTSGAVALCLAFCRKR